MIKIKPLIYANGPAVFNEYIESSSPITYNEGLSLGNIPGGYFFKRSVNWWKLVIYVNAVSGNSPSLIFYVRVDNFTGPGTVYILPQITQPVIYELLQTPAGQLILIQKTSGGDIILSQQLLGYCWGAMGVYLYWFVFGGSPAFSLSSYLIYEDGGEE